MSSEPTPRLPNWTNAPNGGWDYRIPEIKGPQAYVGPVTDYETLSSQIVARYKANDLPVPSDLRNRVEDYICARVPEYCASSGGQITYTSEGLPGFSIKNILAGTGTLLRWMAGGAKKVDLSLANQRAEVCTTCRFNQHPEGCSSCNYPTLMSLVNTIVGGSKTSSDDSLQACVVCGCSLKAKVHLPHDVLMKNMNRDQVQRLPDFCWLITETRD